MNYRRFVEKYGKEINLAMLDEGDCDLVIKNAPAYLTVARAVRWDGSDGYKIDHEKEHVFMRYPLSVLRKYFLYQSSWHHTSRYANRTDFFAISEDAIRNIDINELDRLAEEDRKQRQAPATEKPKKAIISYGEWEGTRSHPRLVMRDEYAIVIGRWAYLESGKKKDLSGRHVESCKTFTRAPKGTASVFRNIEKAMKKKWKKRKP